MLSSFSIVYSLVADTAALLFIMLAQKGVLPMAIVCKLPDFC
jgi:hypothetical protein